MNGSSNIRKPLVSDFPKLRPILFSLSTGTYKWANIFVPLLRHLTSNEFDKTINICANELFKSNSSIHGFNKKKQITEMLSLTIKESIILFHMAFSHSS